MFNIIKTKSLDVSTHLPAKLIELFFYQFLFQTSPILLFYLIFHYPLSCVHPHAVMEASFRRTRASEHILFLFSFLCTLLSKKILAEHSSILEEREKKKGERDRHQKAQSFLRTKKYVCELVLFLRSTITVMFPFSCVCRTELKMNWIRVYDELSQYSIQKRCRATQKKTGRKEKRRQCLSSN